MQQKRQMAIAIKVTAKATLHLEIHYRYCARLSYFSIIRGVEFDLGEMRLQSLPPAVSVCYF